MNKIALVSIFLVGFISGKYSSVFWFEMNLARSQITSRASSQLQQQSAYHFPQKDRADSGFRPVYVYRGNRTENLPDVQYSQVKQDLVILKLFELHALKAGNGNGNDDASRFFIDLAANDAVKWSNTLLLEKRGWRGICVEPNPQYWYGLAYSRTCDVAGAFVGGTEDSHGVKVNIHGLSGGIVGKDYDNKRSKVSVASRFTVSFLTLLKTFNSPRVIDYLSLDVEGAESLILKDFPFDKYIFLVATIERPKKDLQQLLKKNKYTYVAALSNWGESLWIHESFQLDPVMARKVVFDTSADAKKINKTKLDDA